jgi:proline iminopeptidase
MSVFTQPLSRRFCTIAPDLRGYGRSSTRQPFAISDHLDDVIALLDRLSIDRCLVLGWSLGGIIALELALRAPQRISGLILIATAAHPWGTHPAISWQEQFWTGLAAVINQIKPAWSWNIKTLGQRSLLRYLIGQHPAEAYQFLAQEGVYAYLNTSHWASKALSAAMQQGYNRVQDLPRINCPSLMLMGEQDRHIDPRASVETAAALPSCEWHCYPGTAHLFPWEIPQQVTAAIEAWINRHCQAICN